MYIFVLTWNQNILILLARMSYEGMFMEKQPLEGIRENLLKTWKINNRKIPQPAFTCSKLTIEALEQP